MALPPPLFALCVIARLALAVFVRHVAEADLLVWGRRALAAGLGATGLAFALLALGVLERGTGIETGGKAIWWKDSTRWFHAVTFLLSAAMLSIPSGPRRISRLAWRVLLVDALVGASASIAHHRTSSRS